MRKITLTAGGQISVPAAIRRRWNTTAVTIEDRGDELIVRPVPRDPIAAFRGSLKEGLGGTSESLRAHAREDEQVALERRERGRA